MKIELGCPTTIGEFNRLTKNLQVYNKLNEEQRNWFEEFMDNHNYEFKKVALSIVDDILWVIINTGNSVKQFEE